MDCRSIQGTEQGRSRWTLLHIARPTAKLGWSIAGFPLHVARLATKCGQWPMNYLNCSLVSASRLSVTYLGAMCSFSDEPAQKWTRIETPGSVIRSQAVDSKTSEERLGWQPTCKRDVAAFPLESVTTYTSSQSRSLCPFRHSSQMTKCLRDGSFDSFFSRSRIFRSRARDLQHRRSSIWC